MPFLERASLEDDQSKLCDRWSDLLVSAATEFDPSMIRFSAVLAEIGPAEASLVNRMVRKWRGKMGLNRIEDVPLLFLPNVLEKAVSSEAERQISEKKLYRELIGKFEYPGTVWPFLGIEDFEFGHPTWTETNDAVASNLVSLGVLHHLDGLEGKLGGFEWYGHAYALTRFCLRFLLACDLSLKKELAQINQALEERERVARRAD